jgi:two-component system response regulator ArlR
MSAAKILIIEDEVKIARFLQLELEHEGYEVGLVHDGRMGLDMALDGKYGLVILDVMLPSLNGMEILRRLRLVSQVPVIMLTARGEIMDKVMGLDSGADDYIVKPFAIEELLARIRKALRKSGCPQNGEDVLTNGRLSLDSNKHYVTFAGEPVNLTKTEFDLLKFLLQNKDIVLTRNTILEKVWGYDYSGDTNVVDVYIRYLRSKLDDRFNKRIIHTVRGVGYQIKNEE